MLDALAFLLIAIIGGGSAVFDYRAGLTKSAAWSAAGTILLLATSVVCVMKALA